MKLSNNSKKHRARLREAQYYQYGTEWRIACSVISAFESVSTFSSKSDPTQVYKIVIIAISRLAYVKNGCDKVSVLVRREIIPDLVEAKVHVLNFLTFKSSWRQLFSINLDEELTVSVSIVDVDKSGADGGKETCESTLVFGEVELAVVVFVERAELAGAVSAHQVECWGDFFENKKAEKDLHGFLSKVAAVTFLPQFQMSSAETLSALVHMWKASSMALSYLPFHLSWIKINKVNKKLPIWECCQHLQWWTRRWSRSGCRQRLTDRRYRRRWQRRLRRKWRRWISFLFLKFFYFWLSIGLDRWYCEWKPWFYTVDKSSKEQRNSRQERRQAKVKMCTCSNRSCRGPNSQYELAILRICAKRKRIRFASLRRNFLDFFSFSSFFFLLFFKKFS